MLAATLRRSAIAALLLLGAAAHAAPVDDLLRQADPATASAVVASADARAALTSLANAQSRVSRDALKRLMANRDFASFAVNTLRDLAAVKDVVGVERVVDRMTHHDRRLIAGASFEINVAARYGSAIAEMSPTIQVTDLA